MSFEMIVDAARNIERQEAWIDACVAEMLRDCSGWIISPHTFDLEAGSKRFNVELWKLKHNDMSPRAEHVRIDIHRDGSISLVQIGRYSKVDIYCLLGGGHCE